ncbi:MAG: hypothetical protein NWE93_03060 [Candidatus Bathyarchaeota archaeon]|nr:hypothetical protein [Candidatus Bathyarchaeota archaeon]
MFVLAFFGLLVLGSAVCGVVDGVKMHSLSKNLIQSIYFFDIG